MQMERKGDRIFVESTADGSPARSLGVLDGDEVLRVGDEGTPTDVDAVGDLIANSPRPLVITFRRAPESPGNVPEPPPEPGAVEEIVFETDRIGMEMREEGGRFFVDSAPSIGSAADIGGVRPDWEVVSVAGQSELPSTLDALCEVIASSTRPLTISFRHPDSAAEHRGSRPEHRGNSNPMELLQPTLVLYRDQKWPTVVSAYFIRSQLQDVCDI